MRGKDGMCSRTQFPLTIAYAIIIYKSQGMTLPKVVLNITKDFSPGLTYVAMSRVRSLQDIMFEEPFSFDRFKGKPSSLAIQRWGDKNRRRL